jgi:hypothetical protein
MSIPVEALTLEKFHLDSDGQPSLARAFEILLEHWNRGARDRELALHLLFLSWYGLIEPEHLTGFDSSLASQERLRSTFNEIHDFVRPEIERDSEMLYVVGLMAHLAPWLLGDYDDWEQRSMQYRRLYRGLTPNGLDPSIFDGRGAYGEYFQGQVAVIDGY